MNITYSLTAYEEIYSLCLHIMTCIEIPLHSFGLYLILFKTPPRMKSVKKTLLVQHVITILLDLLMSTLTAPVIVLPSLVAYSLGLFSKLGVPTPVQWYIFATTLAVFVASLESVFENRYYVFASGVGRLESGFRVFRAILNYVLAFVWVIPVFLTAPDLETGKQYYMKLFPGIPSDVYQRPDIYVVHLDWGVVAAAVGITSSITGWQMFASIYLTLRILYTNARRSNLSPATLSMQRKLFIAICLQFLVPFGYVAGPLYLCALTFVTMYFNHAINLIIMFIISLHGTMSTVLLILVHEPYRTATLDTFKINCFRTLPTNVVEVTQSRTSS